MKKINSKLKRNHFIFFLTTLVLLVITISSPTYTNAARRCDPNNPLYGFATSGQWSVSPQSVEQGGVITISVNNSDLDDSQPYFVVVNPVFSGNNLVSSLAQAPISISLSGSTTITIPDNQSPGPVSIVIVDSATGESYACSNPKSATVTQSQDNCGQLGQACCTGATQKKCDENFTDNGLKLVCNPQNVCILGDDPIGATPEPTIAEISRGCPNTDEINTAIGCIPFGSSSALVTFFVSWGLGISGGVAMLSLIYSAFMIMTSAGDPKRLEMGREMVVSSLSGIVLIAFSVFMLRLIGIDILGLFI
jgi:hypothetical protein